MVKIPTTTRRSAVSDVPEGFISVGKTQTGVDPETSGSLTSFEPQSQVPIEVERRIAKSQGRDLDAEQEADIGFKSVIVENERGFFVVLDEDRAFPAGQSREGIQKGKLTGERVKFTEGFTRETGPFPSRQAAEIVQRNVEGARQSGISDIPEGFVKQTDDVFAGQELGKAEEIRAAVKGRPVPILDKLRNLVTKFRAGDPKDAEARFDLIVGLARRNRLSFGVVEANLDAILANPRLSGAIKPPTEEQRKTIAFTQALAESITFGVFDPEIAIQQEFPLEATAGMVSGAVLTFIATRGVLQAAGLTQLSIRGGEAARVLFAAAPRFIPASIRTGSVFATVSGVRKAVEQVENKDINVLELGGEIMLSFAEGAALGAATVTLGFARRVFIATSAGTISGQVRGHSLAESAVMGVIWGTLEVFGGAGKDVGLRGRALVDVRNSLAKWARKADPNMTLQEAFFQANRYINTVFQSAQIQAGKTISMQQFLESGSIRHMEKFAQIVMQSMKDLKGVKGRGINVLDMATKGVKKLIGKVKGGTEVKVVVRAPGVSTKKSLAGTFTAAQQGAVVEVANILSNFEPSQVARDAEGVVTGVLGGGFPDPIGGKGYTTKDIDAVVKKVQEGKPLTERQAEIFEDMMVLHGQAVGDFGVAEKATETVMTPAQKAEAIAGLEQAKETTRKFSSDPVKMKESLAILDAEIAAIKALPETSTGKVATAGFAAAEPQLTRISETIRKSLQIPEGQNTLKAVSKILKNAGILQADVDSIMSNALAITQQESGKVLSGEVFEGITQHNIDLKEAGFAAVEPIDFSSEDFQIKEGGVKLKGKTTLDFSSGEQIDALIDRVDVDKALRGKGIGTKAVKSFEKWAISKGAVDAYVESEEGSIDFWQKMGYKILVRGSDDVPTTMVKTLSSKTLAARPDPTTAGPLPEGEVAVPILNENQLKSIARKKNIKAKQEAIGSRPDIKLTLEDLIRQHTAQIALGMFDIARFSNSIRQALTPEQRIMIPFIIEGTDMPIQVEEIFNLPGLVEQFNAQKESLKPIAAQVSEVFKERWDFIVANTEKLTAEEITAYVNHFWEAPKQAQHFGKPKQSATIANWFITTNKFLKKRTIATYLEGIEMGFIPKTLDITELLEVHGQIMVKTIANQQLVKVLESLKINGVPLIERADKAPLEWISRDIPALRKLLIIPGKAQREDKVSNDLVIILNQMGLAIGRKLAPTVFGRPSRTLGVFRPGKRPPEIALRKFFTSRTLAHEIGHFLDINVLGLGKNFINQFKDEIYALNRARIKRFTGQPAPYGQEYAESVEEQLAELFAFIFADLKTAKKLAPNATAKVLEILRGNGVLTKLVNLDFENNAKITLERQLDTIRDVGVKFHPDLEQAFNVIFGQRFTMGDITIPLPFGRSFGFNLIGGYEMVNGLIKKMQLSLSLFHPGALVETGVATVGPIKATKIATGIDGKIPFKKVYAAMFKGEFDAFKNVELSRDAIEHGVQIGATADIPVKKIQKQLNDFSKRLKHVPVAKDMALFIATFNEKWDIALWNYLHDGLKLYSYEHLVSSFIDPTKDITKQKQEIAQMVNDTYGGQNWANLMVSPKVLQLMTWSLLSPDWFVSTVRQGLAFGGFGAIHKEFGGIKGLRGKLGQKFWLKAFLWFGIGVNLANALNRAADKKRHPEKYKDRDFQDMLMGGNALGHKTHLFMGRWEDGSERYLRWGKQFREVPELFMGDLGFNPFEGTRTKLGGKAAPIPQTLSIIFTGHTLSGFRIRSVAEAEGWERTFETILQIAKTPLPFASRNLVEEGKEFHITDLAMPQSKGMTRFKAIQLYKIGIKRIGRGGENIIKEVSSHALMNNLPASTLLTAAATSLRAEATIELNRNLRSIADVDKALSRTTDIKEIGKLNKTKARFQAEREEIKILEKNSEIIEIKTQVFQLEFGLD